MSHAAPAPSTRIRQALTLWGMGVSLGTRLLRSDPRLGVKRLVLPVNYWRTAEFGYVLRRLPRARALVLDVGSPKELAVFLASSRGHHVTATDILPEAVEQARSYAATLPRRGGDLAAVVQDGRALDYPDGSFDAAFSVSVLEHIPHDGDSAAIRELVRVVKPGGEVIVTVPYAERYRETFVRRGVYERSRAGEEEVFYQRHYDEETLRRRLLAASGAELVDLELWGEGRFRAEGFFARHRVLRNAVAPAEALLACACLRRIRGPEDGTPMAAFFTLRR